MNIGFAAVRRYYRWWLGELSALMVLRRSKSAHWRYLLRRDAEGIEIFENDGRTAVSLTKIKFAAASKKDQAAPASLEKMFGTSKGVVLRMSEDDVIEKIVQLPKAASDVIEPVLHNQMNRIVPWPQNETHYGFEVLGPNAETPEQIDIRIAAARRSMLTARQGEVIELGLAPEIIDYAPGLEIETGIRLLSLRPDPREKIGRILHLSLICLFTTSIALGGFGFYQLGLRSAENTALNADILTVRSRIAEISQSYAENAEQAALRGRLSKRKAEQPSVVVLIEALSRTLPDTAFLTDLKIRGSKIRFAGKSSEAPSLIAAIEDAAQFENAHFAAPTTRSQDEPLESFAIVAEAKPHRLASDGEHNSK